MSVLRLPMCLLMYFRFVGSVHDTSPLYVIRPHYWSYRTLSASQVACSPGNLNRALYRLEHHGPSQVPVETYRAFALVFDPGRYGKFSPYRTHIAVPATHNTKTPAKGLFSGLYPNSLCTPGIRLRATITDDYAILGSGCWLGFAGQDLINLL